MLKKQGIKQEMHAVPAGGQPALSAALLATLASFLPLLSVRLTLGAFQPLRRAEMDPRVGQTRPGRLGEGPPPTTAGGGGAASAPAGDPRAFIEQEVKTHKASAVQSLMFGLCESACSSLSCCGGRGRGCWRRRCRQLRTAPAWMPVPFLQAVVFSKQICPSSRKAKEASIWAWEGMRVEHGGLRRGQPRPGARGGIQHSWTYPPPPLPPGADHGQPRRPGRLRGRRTLLAKWGRVLPVSQHHRVCMQNRRKTCAHP